MNFDLTANVNNLLATVAATQCVSIPDDTATTLKEGQVYCPVCRKVTETHVIGDPPSCPPGEQTPIDVAACCNRHVLECATTDAEMAEARQIEAEETERLVREEEAEADALAQDGPRGSFGYSDDEHDDDCDCDSCVDERRYYAQDEYEERLGEQQRESADW